MTLYARGMSWRDIYKLLTDMYGMDISPLLISKITDRLTTKNREMVK